MSTPAVPSETAPSCGDKAIDHLFAVMSEEARIVGENPPADLIAVLRSFHRLRDEITIVFHEELGYNSDPDQLGDRIKRAEEHLASLYAQRRGRRIGGGRYYCTICGRNAVHPEEGEDTCSTCRP